MADDSLFVTRRLKRIAEATEEELEAAGDTIELESLDLMATTELKRLLDPTSQSTDSIGDDDESEDC